jgi:hypothetical protein
VPLIYRSPLAPYISRRIRAGSPTRPCVRRTGQGLEYWHPTTTTHDDFQFILNGPRPFPIEYSPVRRFTLPFGCIAVRHPASQLGPSARWLQAGWGSGFPIRFSASRVIGTPEICRRFDFYGWYGGNPEDLASASCVVLGAVRCQTAKTARALCIASLAIGTCERGLAEGGRMC